MAEPREVPVPDAGPARENQVLRRQFRDLLALMGLPALWVGRDAAAMAGTLADVLLSALHLEVAYVRLVDPADGRTLEVARGRSGPLSPEQAGLVRAALEAALATGDERQPAMPHPADSGTLAVGVLPLRGAGSGGVLTAARSAGYPTEYDRLLLNAAGNQLVFALRERHLLREEARLLESVNRVGRALAGELDIQKLMQALTDAATEITRAQFGAFFYNDRGDRGEAYMLYTLSGAPKEAFSGFPMPRNTAIFHPTFSGERAVRWEDVTRAPEYGQNPPFDGMPPGHLPVRSYLAVPVVSRSGEVLGGLFFGHERCGVFTDREEKLVVALAAQAAIAIDNARLFEGSQKLYAQAQEANRVKDEFLATLSHELRTPLNAIVGWVHLLRSGQLDAETTSHALEVIARNAEAQNQLVADMLDVSRITTGRLRLDVRPVDLLQVASSALDTVRPAAQARGVRLHSALDPDASDVSGDPERLQQVVWNLLSNAIRFTPRGGDVTVRLERAGSKARLSVADTGVGIPSEFLPHVFELFRQADSSSTRRHGGLGLGLAIVRHLVELHGGSAEAWSAGPGQGAIFTVELPLQAVVPVGTREAREEGAADAEGSLSGVRVLLVEDDPDSRDLIATVLARAGAAVTPVGTVADALQSIDESCPDLLLSDIEMPEQDGYELIRRVRSRPEDEHGHLPAVALTAYAGPQDGARALEAGFELHLPKPVQPRELVRALARLAQGVRRAD